MEHNAKNICKTVISGVEQNLNKHMDEFGISILFQYFLNILAEFNAFSRSWKPILQFNTFNTAWEPWPELCQRKRSANVHRAILTNYAVLGIVKALIFSYI